MRAANFLLAGLVVMACESPGAEDVTQPDAGVDATAPDAAVADAGADVGVPVGVECGTVPIAFPGHWRSCQIDADCTTGTDWRDCSIWVFGIAKAFVPELEAASRYCREAVPPFGGCQGLPHVQTDKGSVAHEPYFGVSCDSGSCTSKPLTAGSACDDHATCPGDSLCLSDPCHNPPCPANGFSPVCHVCGGGPPCHCGYYLGFTRCEGAADCADASCGCDGCGACTPPCTHGFCAPAAGDTTLPFCGL